MNMAAEQAVPQQETASVFAGLRKRMDLTVKRMQVPQEQVLELVTQLSIMFDTGLNLSSALEVLEKQSGTPHLARFVSSIRRNVEEGKPLSVAMSYHRWAFSPVALALVRAGEMTGDLGKMLGKVADFMDRDITTRKKVKGAMAYPAFMAILATGVVIFLLVNVFPKFAVLFEKDPSKLPGPTRFFMNLSDFLVAHGTLVVPAVLVGAMGLIITARSSKGRELVDPIYLKLPAFGNLIRAVALSRAFHVLGVMLNAGLNVLEALDIASAVSGNNEYVKLWARARKDVTNGGDLSATLTDNPLVPPAETAILSLGERSGTLPEVLTKISHHHEKKVDNAIRTFIAVIEPTMTILMGAVVALIVTSLIMPMFAISQVMK